MKNQVQIINQDGRPAFAVLPYDEYLTLLGNKTSEEDETTFIPHEVAKTALTDDVSLLAAWRKYLKISQQELAKRMNISQAAVSQMEKLNAPLQGKTIEKAAKALGITAAQLTED